jgi:carboxymethylenebutenolidase
MTMEVRRGVGGGDIPVYEARPQGPSRGQVLVAHEIFGLTPHIRSVCDRLAAEGYRAMAPNLFARAQQDEPLPYSAEGKSAGLRIKNALSEKHMAEDLVALVDRSEPFCAVLGFCLGGTLAWIAAQRAPVHAAVAYYAVGLPKHLGRPLQCPVMFHFGRKDPSVPPEAIAQVAKAYPEVVIHEYNAGHAFNRDDDAAYVPAAAKDAWARTLAFFHAQTCMRVPA